LGIAEIQEGALDVDPAEIEKLIEERNTARTDKNFTRADEIRDQFVEMGIEIMDGPEGTTWRKA
jgi:cysteinyl-tRNA synthetase